MNKKEYSSIDALKYCLEIEDDPEVRKYITTSSEAFIYCRMIKNRPEIIEDASTLPITISPVSDRPLVTSKSDATIEIIEFFHSWNASQTGFRTIINACFTNPK